MTEKEVVPEIKNKCRNALLASLEILREECAGEKGVYRTIDENLIIYVPESFIREIESKTGYKFNSLPDRNSEEFNRILKTMMDNEWLDKFANKILGENAPSEVKKAFKENILSKLLV